MSATVSTPLGLRPTVMPPIAPSSMFQAPMPGGLPAFGNQPQLAQNWRIQFRDANGNPLNMLSFEEIDFGAISYKEIFQNVKTILATPLYSAVLERTLGIDATIVDRPMNRAAEATVAYLQALYSWEPRVEVVNISFSSDGLSGHLTADLQLKIRNVIYGTNIPYTQANVFMPTQETTDVSAPIIIQGPPGPPGATGTRGSLWFTGSTDPGGVGTPPAPSGGFLPNDMYLNTTSGDVFQYTSTGTWRKVGA